jgi:AraC-like DNA-binding protein
MDALSTLIEATKLQGVVYSKIFNHAPWGIDAVQDNNSQYWRLVSGACFIGLPNGQLIEMQEGELVFIPHGSAHWIADKPGSLRISAADYVKARLAGIPIFGGHGAETTLIGGHFHFEDGLIHPFLKDLPQIIRIPKFETERQLLLQQNIRLIWAELNNDEQGSRAMLKALAEILFIQIIRAYLEQDIPDIGFLAALKDARISKALKLIHDSPGSDWTMESMADSVGMSRSVFFNRFKNLVGETPSNYLTGWRIRKAKELLVTANTKITDIAASVGYQSEAAFNRIFKSKTGKTPALYRRDFK